MEEIALICNNCSDRDLTVSITYLLFGGILLNIFVEINEIMGKGNGQQDWHYSTDNKTNRVN